MNKRNKTLALAVFIIVVGLLSIIMTLFVLRNVSASDNEVNDQTLIQEENEALRAENEEINEVARELDQQNQKLEQSNRDLYGQIIIYRDQVNQMRANEDREVYMEGE